MSLERLARELDETSRQTEKLVEDVSKALDILGDTSIGSDDARRRAVLVIVQALQGQDRVAQRCQDLALAVRQFDKLPAGTPASAYDEIWAGLILDELRVPGLSGTAKDNHHGEVELF